MKYAHLADLHLGSWREPKLRELSTKAFLQAMDYCRQREADFILFAGDIFDTALPALDLLKTVTRKLKELQEKEIPVYCIAGSHDFSPSGKTMIEVLEQAGLLANVGKGRVEPETRQLQLQFTLDRKTGAKITGLPGRKGQLDRLYYENLFLADLEREPGYKIFLFHTSVTELKPRHLEKVDSQPVTFLPKGFDYYAGGHLHHPTKAEIPGYGTLTYPGALFPNNFREIEEYSPGGFYFITTEPGQQQLDWIPLKVIEHQKLIVDCRQQSPEVIAREIQEYFGKKEIVNALLTIRLTGILESGKLSDLNWNEITTQLYSQGAYLILRNTSQLSSSSFEEIKLAASSNQEQLEEEIIKEHLQQVKLFSAEQELEVTKALLAGINITKKEGETIADFQRRMEQELEKILPA